MVPLIPGLTRTTIVTTPVWKVMPLATGSKLPRNQETTPVPPTGGAEIDRPPAAEAKVVPGGVASVMTTLGAGSSPATV